MYKTTALCDIRNYIFADFHAQKKLWLNFFKKRCNNWCKKNKNNTYDMPLSAKM